MDSRQRYKAFISYSHRDLKTAVWLHRALEAYRAPRKLTQGQDDRAWRSLRPIFRDRDELSASLDLSETIRSALDRSDALIVLCSPASAASRWVDQEVAHFLKGRDTGRIICVVAPSAPLEAPVETLLPPALRAALPTGVEPLAVDLRRDGDGRRLARLKIAAQLLGVRLDQLVQRDARRRLQLMAAFTTAAVILAIGMGAMTVATLKSREIARRQRDETEALVAFMLGDLRQQLEPLGRLDLLDGVSAKVLAYYAKAPTERLDDRALGQRAKAQTLLGTIREQRGDLAGAQDAFGQAAATTHALVQRDPRNGERIFDEAQNVFWLGYVQWRREDVAGAERGFKRYGELARTLVTLDPSRRDWWIEVAYAKNNLGTLLFEQNRPAEALEAFRAGYAVFQAQRERAPKDQTLMEGAANSRAWAADCLLRLGRPREALSEREAAARILDKAIGEYPKDKRLQARGLGGQLALARLELDLGQVEAARARFSRTIAQLRGLAKLDPTNVRWREFLVTGRMDTLDLESSSGHAREAEVARTEAAEMLAQLRSGPKAEAWRADLDGRLAQLSILLARRNGQHAHARAMAETLARRMKSTNWRKEPDGAALYGFAEWAAGRAASAADILETRQGALSPASRDTLARAYLDAGQAERASVIVRDLAAHGYAHPGFLAFWRDSPVGGALAREAHE